MGWARKLLQKLLHPPGWVLIFVPLLSFAALAAVFIRQCPENILVYLIYSLSAYSLTIWLAALLGLTKRAKSAMMGSKLMRKAAASPIMGRYFKDLAFRGSISIYQGIAVNLFYVAFRIMAAIRYASVWFLSMAVYYLVLGGLRAYLIVYYRRRTPELERRCYHTTAWFLFLLNIPMGGMIVLMVRTDSGFSYPGYVIYLSALYTFYTLHNDHICDQSNQVPQAGQPDPVCRKGAAFRCRHDVDLGPTDGHDLSVFRKRRELPQNDECHHGRLRLRYRYFDCNLYAASRQIFEKEGGIC